MKKFTKIDEDAEIASAKIVNEFDKKFEEAQLNLKKISDGLNEMKTEFFGDPTGRNKSNWGFIGNLNYVNDELQNILEFLGNNDSLGSTLIPGGYQPNKDNTSPIPPDGGSGVGSMSDLHYKYSK